MANGGRIGQLPDDLIGNEGLPSRVVSNERLEMLEQQIRRNTHVDSLRQEGDALPAIPQRDGQATKSLMAGITVSGASSMSQWPTPVTTLPRTSDATSLACSMRKVPPAFSPDRTSSGMASRVLPMRAKSSPSRSKLREYSKPARMAPCCAYARA